MRRKIHILYEILLSRVDAYSCSQYLTKRLRDASSCMQAKCKGPMQRNTIAQTKPLAVTLTTTAHCREQRATMVRCSHVAMGEDEMMFTPLR
jgi:hypothetical protein